MNGETARESAKTGGGGGGGGEGEVVQTLLGGAAGVGPTGGLGGVVSPELAGGTEETLIEKTLLSIQEKVCARVSYIEILSLHPSLPPSLPLSLSLSLSLSLPPSLTHTQFDILEQMGFEGYAVLVNTTELQSHFLATSKGRSFHKLRQTQGKPLENPFIGHVFTEEPGM